MELVKRIFILELAKQMFLNLVYIFKSTSKDLFRSDIKGKYQTIFIYVCQWTGTPLLLLFSIELYKKLQRSGGVPVIVYDRQFYHGSFLKYYAQSILDIITLKILGIKFISISQINELKISSKDIKIYNKIYKNYAIQISGIEANTEKKLVNHERFLHNMKSVDYHFSKILNNKSFSKIHNAKFIIPSGMYGPTALLVERLRKLKLSFFTYDSTLNKLSFCKNGVVSQNDNTAYLFNRLKTHKEEKMFSINHAIKEIDRRVEKANINNDSSNVSKLSPYYLILPNISWDVAALNKHIVYKTSLEWLMDTINWLLNNTTDNIVVRLHPHLAFDNLSDGDDILNLTNTTFNSKRVIVIVPSNTISTYKLIESAKMVIGHTSTSLLESVIYGVPTVCVSDAYYTYYDTVFKATSLENYYDAMKGNLSLKQHKESVINAYLIYYISQCCTSINTTFTPIRQNMFKYILGKNNDDTSIFIDSIVRDIDPKGFIHEDNLNQNIYNNLH